MKAPKKTWKDFLNTPECAEALFFTASYFVFIGFMYPTTTLTFMVISSSCYIVSLLTYLSKRRYLQGKVLAVNSWSRDMHRHFHQNKVKKLNNTYHNKPNEHPKFIRKKHIIFEEKPKKTSLINYHQYIPEGNLENFRDTVENLHRSKWTCPISYELLDIPILMEGDNNARGIICLTVFRGYDNFSDQNVQQILAIKDPVEQSHVLRFYVDDLFQAAFGKRAYIPSCGNVVAEKISFAHDYAQMLNADLEEYSKTKTIENVNIDYIHKRICIDNIPLAENNAINYDPLNTKDEQLIQRTKAHIEEHFPYLKCPISNKLPKIPCSIFHRKKTYHTIYDYDTLIEYFKTYNKTPNNECYTINCPTIAASSFKGPKTYSDAPILITPEINTSIIIQKCVYFLHKSMNSKYLDEETQTTHIFSSADASTP